VSVRLHLLTVALFSLTACGGNWEVIQEETSPSGDLRAVVEYADPGACCSDHSRLRLENTRTGEPLGDNEFVAEISRSRISVIWEGDRLLNVDASGASRVDAQTEIYADPGIVPVRLDIKTVPLCSEGWQDRTCRDEDEKGRPD
jgi:hypothetical protein